MWHFLFLAFQWHRGKRAFVILSLAFLGFLLYASGIGANGLLSSCPWRFWVSCYTRSHMSVEGNGAVRSSPRTAFSDHIGPSHFYGNRPLWIRRIHKTHLWN